MIEYSSESDNELAVASYRPDRNINMQNLDDIYPIIGWGKIVQKNYLPDGKSNIIIEGMGVLELLEYKSIDPFRIGQVREYPRIRANLDNKNYQELLVEIIHLTKRLIINDNAPKEFIDMVQDIYNFHHPIDFISSLLQNDIQCQQSLLEERDELKRGELLREILFKLNLKE